MNVPAYTSPTLCLGRTFDLETSRACADVFPSSSDLPIKSIGSNKFSFKYQVVKSSKDVNDLLDVSGELSLKIKANLLKVEGAGQYINESKLEEGTTSLLAVMKCTTVRIFAEESQRAAFVKQIKVMRQKLTKKVPCHMGNISMKIGWKITNLRCGNSVNTDRSTDL